MIVAQGKLLTPGGGGRECIVPIGTGVEGRGGKNTRKGSSQGKKRERTVIDKEKRGKKSEKKRPLNGLL